VVGAPSVERGGSRPTSRRRRPARSCTVWQVLGGLLWSLGLTLAGYALGPRIPDVQHYLLPIVAVIVVVSLLPVALELLRSRASSR
jgi:membrane-associated protein